MARLSTRDQRVLEICLIVVTIGLTCLLYHFNGYKMVVLNLFYLPVVLAAFFLGCYRAGILTLFSVIAASVVAVLNLDGPAVDTLPVVMALSVAVWGAVLGITAIMVGHLSDERARTLNELHEAYVGVVEVMSQYLQSAHPQLKARAVRVAEMSQKVAEDLKLSPKLVEDIRVAALLYDMEDVEITARVIRRAVGSLESETPADLEQHTFQGKDLVMSLGSVLSGAMSLLLNRGHALDGADGSEIPVPLSELPVGTQILEAVREYDTIVAGEFGRSRRSPKEALKELRQYRFTSGSQNVLHALERVVGAGVESAKEPQSVGTKP